MAHGLVNINRARDKMPTHCTQYGIEIYQKRAFYKVSRFQNEFKIKILIRPIFYFFQLWSFDCVQKCTKH